jgi:hypothetical protein
MPFFAFFAALFASFAVRSFFTAKDAKKSRKGNGTRLQDLACHFLHSKKLDINNPEP